MISIQIFIIMFYHPKEIVRLVRILIGFTQRALDFCIGQICSNRNRGGKIQTELNLVSLWSELLTLMTDAKQLWGEGRRRFLDNRTNRQTSVLKKAPM